MWGVFLHWQAINHLRIVVKPKPAISDNTSWHCLLLAFAAEKQEDLQLYFVHDQLWEELRAIKEGAATASSAGEAVNAGMAAAQQQRKAKQDAAASVGHSFSAFAGQRYGAAMTLQAAAARSGVHEPGSYGRRCVDLLVTD